MADGVTGSRSTNPATSAGIGSRRRRGRGTRTDEGLVRSPTYDGLSERSCQRARAIRALAGHHAHGTLGMGALDQRDEEPRGTPATRRSGHLETPIRQTTTLLLQSCGMHRSRPLEERQTRRSRVRTPGDRASRGRLLHRRDDLPPAPTRSLLHRVGQPPRPSCRLHRPPQRGVGHPAGEHHAGEPAPRDGRPKVRSWSIIGAERTQTGQSAWQARRQL
jgi:hypothetical protein